MTILIIFLIALLVFYGVPLLLRWLIPFLVRRKMERMAEDMRRQQAQAQARAARGQATGNPFADFFAAMYGSAEPAKGKKFDADEGEYVKFEDIRSEESGSREPVDFIAEEQIEDVEWVDVEDEGGKNEGNV